MRVFACETETCCRQALTIVLEPVRVITYMFLGYSNRERDYTKFAPLQDLIWNRTSIIVAVQQYLAAILDGTAPRLRLLWHRRGFASFGAMQDADPAAIAHIRRLTIMVSTALDHRLGKYEVTRL